MMTPFGFSLLDDIRADKEELVIEEDDNKYEIKMGTEGIEPKDISVRGGKSFLWAIAEDLRST